MSLGDDYLNSSACRWRSLTHSQKKYVKEIYVGKFTLPITTISANQKFVLCTISSTTQRPRRNLPCSWRARYTAKRFWERQLFKGKPSRNNVDLGSVHYRNGTLIIVYSNLFKQDRFVDPFLQSMVNLRDTTQTRVTL